MSRRSGSRTRDSRSPRHKYKVGRVTRNPFLNFLRDFRKTNNALKVTELTRRGAEVWRTMNDRQKSPYCQLARQAPRRGRRRRRRRRKGRRGRRRADVGFSSSGSSRSSLEGHGHRNEPTNVDEDRNRQVEKKPSLRTARVSKSRSNVVDLM